MEYDSTAKRIVQRMKTLYQHCKKNANVVSELNNRVKELKANEEAERSKRIVLEQKLAKQKERITKLLQKEHELNEKIKALQANQPKIRFLNQIDVQLGMYTRMIYNII